MSPRIATIIAVILPQSGRPLDRARAAIRAVEQEGIRLVFEGECNAVELHEVTVGWVVDRRRRPIRVNLLGALLLALQPRGPIGELAAATAMAVSPDWLVGLMDGWHCEPQADLLTGPSRELYRDGLRAGGLLFAELTVECEACGSRRYHGEPACIPCLHQR